MKRLIKLFIPLGAILMASGLISATAYATDEKTYPGVGCDERFGTQVANFQRFSPYFLNTSATALLQATCPIDTDNVTDTRLSTQVRINRSAATTASFFCSLDRTNPFGGFIEFVGAATGTTGNSTLFLNSTAASFTGYANLRCNIPAQSRIWGYRVIEQSPTDANN